MTNYLLSRGQALSTFRWGPTAAASPQQIFEGNNSGVTSMKVQGFIWSGTKNCEVKDSQGSVLFNRGVSSPGIYAPAGSGSYGIICTAPFSVTVSGAGTEGTLIVYGEVL